MPDNISPFGDPAVGNAPASPFGDAAVGTVTPDGQPNLDHRGAIPMTKEQMESLPYDEQRKYMEPHSFGRLAREAVQPIIGAGQLLAHGIGQIAPETAAPAMRLMDDAAKENQTAIDESRGGATGTNWEQIAVDFLNPVNIMTGRVGQLATAGRLGRTLGVAGERFVAPVTGSAAASVIQPVTDAKSEVDYWHDKKTAAELGAAIGVVPGLGGAAFDIRDDARRLMTEDRIPLSIGQAKGGVAKELEQRGLTNIPVASRLAQNANEETIREFNRAAYDRALSLIGQRYPADGPIGHEGISRLHDLVSDNYQNVLNNYRNVGGGVVQRPTLSPNSPGFYNRIQQNLGHAFDEMTEQDKGVFLRMVDNVVGGRLRSHQGSIDGDLYKQIESDLTKRENTQRKQGNEQLADMLEQLSANLRQELEIQNPGIANELRQADMAYHAYRRVGEASRSRLNGDGIFSTGDYLNSIRRRAVGTGRDKQFEDGLAPLQDFAERAYRVIPNVYSDSGTAGRQRSSSLIEHAITGLAGGAGGVGAMLHPETVIPALGIAGTAALPYTRPWMRAARSLSATGHAQKEAAGRVITGFTPGAAAAANDPSRKTAPVE